MIGDGIEVRVRRGDRSGVRLGIVATPEVRVLALVEQRLTMIR